MHLGPRAQRPHQVNRAEPGGSLGQVRLGLLQDPCKGHFMGPPLETEGKVCSDAWYSTGEVGEKLGVINCDGFSGMVMVVTPAATFH